MQNNVLSELLKLRYELFGFIRALVRNTHDAEDLFQEVARIVVEKASAPGAEIRDFRAWAKEIARRQTLQFFRERRAQKIITLPVEEMAELAGDVYARYSPVPADLTREHEALRKCLEKIPAKTGTMVQLRYASDLAYDEIAERLRATEASVRRAVARARLALVDCVRREMQNSGEDA
jgi:RNA polymerase sigma-70 factor, ECF subfamily